MTTPSMDRWVWKQQYLPEWTEGVGEDISGTRNGLEISESQLLVTNFDTIHDIFDPANAKK